MLFCTKLRDISIKKIMTSVPGFPPKGFGTFINNRHSYTAKECDCTLCLYYKRKKCTLLKCKCIEERIQAAAVGYMEFMEHTFEPIKNKAFQERLQIYLKEREYKKC